jgi:hypothetical protein
VTDQDLEKGMITEKEVLDIVTAALDQRMFGWRGGYEEVPLLVVDIRPSMQSPGRFDLTIHETPRHQLTAARYRPGLARQAAAIAWEVASQYIAMLDPDPA